MTKGSAWFLAAAVMLSSCGIGAKPSPYRKSYGAASKLYSAAKRKFDAEEYNGALSALDDFAKAADKLVVKIPPGDRYREKIRTLIADAGKLRDKVTEKKLRGEKRDVKVASARKPVDYKEFWGEDEEEDLSEKVDPAELARRRSDAAKRTAEEQRKRTALADMEARKREVVARQKLGEIDEEALKKAEKQKAARRARTDPLKKPKMPKGKITEETKPLQTVKVCRKGNAVVVYMLLVNKGDKPFRVGSVTGDLLDGGTNFVDRVGMAFEANGFKPNWENIFDSGGTAVTAESLVVDAKSKKMIALVAQHKDAARISKVRLKIPTNTGEFFDGPD